MGVTEAAAREAASAWFPGAVHLAPLGAGHINDTWLLHHPDRGRFVLQRLSPAVFPHPREVADKVARVVTHLSGHGVVRVPDLVTTRAGGRWYEDPWGGVWRLWVFAAGTRSLTTLTNEAEAVAAGAAFGHFQLAIADLPGTVEDPIPGFMRLSHYLGELDAVGPVPDAEAERALSMVEARRDVAGSLEHRDRLIHGDCKIDNLLFREHADAVTCIIDLDTVMVGHWGWDVGDLARSAAADGARVNVARFAAIARGFVGTGAVSPGPEVADTLVLAPRYVALTLGVRFLTDHLCGDRYFKVRSPGDNLARARVQLALVEDMERQERALAAAVRRI